MPFKKIKGITIKKQFNVISQMTSKTENKEHLASTFQLLLKTKTLCFKLLTHPAAQFAPDLDYRITMKNHQLEKTTEI